MLKHVLLKKKTKKEEHSTISSSAHVFLHPLSLYYSLKIYSIYNKPRWYYLTPTTWLKLVSCLSYTEATNTNSSLLHPSTHILIHIHSHSLSSSTLFSLRKQVNYVGEKNLFWFPSGRYWQELSLPLRRSGTILPDGAGKPLSHFWHWWTLLFYHTSSHEIFSVFLHSLSLRLPVHRLLLTRLTNPEEIDFCLLKFTNFLLGFKH